MSFCNNFQMCLYESIREITKILIIKFAYPHNRRVYYRFDILDTSLENI